MAEEISVSITSQDILSLKQSCQVIISAYKKYASSILVQDENGIYPVMLEQVKGLRVDIEAGVDTLDSYNKITLEDIERPSSSFQEIETFKEIENISGNFTMSQSLYDEAQDEVKEIFEGLKHRQAPVSTETKGGDFKHQNLISKSEEKYSTKKYTQSLPLSKNEEIGSLEENNLSIKKVNEEITIGESSILSSEKKASSHRSKTKGIFQNTILEECIPCDLRLTNLDGLSISADIDASLGDLIKKYQELADKMDALFTNTDIADDLCSICNFLDFHCLPDLFAITAMLSALLTKNSDLMFNLDGAFMQFIGPFFSPLLNGLTGILDQYSKMIMRPVDCVLNSLDTQLSKIDGERALDLASIQNIAYHRRREGYLRRKKEDLRSRRAFLTSIVDKGANPLEAPPQKIGGEPRSSQSNVLRDAIEEKPESNKFFELEFSSPVSRTISEELERLDSDISETDQKWQEEAAILNKEIKLNRTQNPSIAGQARSSIRDVRRGISSSLYELREQVLNSRKMMNDTLTVMSGELQRLIAGRAATSEEMVENARNIQKLARLIGFVKSLIKLANGCGLCKNSNGDPSVALGSFLTANKGTEPSNNYYNVYIGKNVKGDKSLLIASSDAVLELSDPETENITQLNNLAEINKLNNDGIPKDLGDITDKKIMATIPELGVQAPVSIIKFDLCNNSNLSTEPDIEKIQSWASSAGFNI